MVTTEAIDLSSRVRLCIAVAPHDPQGVWWWEPGASGCGRRSTDVFHADAAAVSRATESAVVTVAFRVQVHSATPPSFLDVRLVVEDDLVRTLDHRARVTVHRRQDLDLPWELTARR